MISSILPWRRRRSQHLVSGQNEAEAVSSAESHDIDMPAAAPSDEIVVGKETRGWFIDSVQVERGGVVRLVGWSLGCFEADQMPSVYANGELLSVLQDFRYPRRDVAAKMEPGKCLQDGLAVEYLIPDRLFYQPVELSIDFGHTKRTAGPYTFVNADYRALLNSETVWHREHIYGSGIPNETVHPDILNLASRLPGPVLDFGCGRGALIASLRKSGTDVQGLEFESPILLPLIPEELKSVITFYNGEFPVPFADEQFRSVVCSEVLEHIPNYESAIAEIARITSDTALFTVPNASAIPLGYRHGAVPWHLMEGSHVNFFSQKSLQAALGRHFKQIEFGRIGPSRFNDSPYFVTLVALCSKQETTDDNRMQLTSSAGSRDIQTPASVHQRLF